MKKDPEPAKELPPITTSGEGTFGCRVNGVVWLPESDKSWEPMQARWIINDSAFALSMDRYIYSQGGLRESVDLLMFPFTGAKQYSLNNESNGYYSKHKENKVFITRSGPGGSLNILKLDTTKRIISGTFFFTAIDTVNHDTVKITDGRFDLTYFTD